MAYLKFRGIPLWEHLWFVPTVYVLSALGQSGTHNISGHSITETSAVCAYHIYNLVLFGNGPF